MAGAPCGIGWRHPHHEELLERRPALDFLEVHAENFFAAGGAAPALLERARADYALSLHGVGLGLGSRAGLDRWHLDQLARLVERVDPMLVSDHACFARVELPGRTQHAADLLPIPFDETSLQGLTASVTQVQERLKRRIAVENLSAYLGWQQDCIAEPEFFNRLTRQSGCGLLLDLNNLIVNARNAGADDPLRVCQDWVDAIAPESVMEIHLAGHTVVDGLAIDDHGSAVSEPVWRLYRHAIARLGPRPTLIEWDTEVPALEVLLAEAARAARESA